MLGTIRYLIAMRTGILIVGAGTAATSPTVKSIKTPEGILFVGSDFIYCNNLEINGS